MAWTGALMSVQKVCGKETRHRLWTCNYPAKHRTSI